MREKGIDGRHAEADGLGLDICCDTGGEGRRRQQPKACRSMSADACLRQLGKSPLRSTTPSSS